MQQQASGHLAADPNHHLPAQHQPNPHPPVHQPHGHLLPQPPAGLPMLLGQVGGQVQGVQGLVGVNLVGLPGAGAGAQDPPHLQFPPNM